MRSGLRRAGLARLALAALAALAAPAALYAADISVRRVALALDSGLHRGARIASGAPEKPAEVRLAASQALQIPQAQWLRLEFGEIRLGSGSFLRISGADGAVQTIDADAARLLRKRSAFFNGDRVLLELHVASGDPGAQFVVQRALVNGAEHPARPAIPPGDTRRAASDRRVGRALVERADGRVLICTAWLVGAGVAVTAGHCAHGLVQVHFEPPASAADGELRFPPPERQFWPEPNTLRVSNGAPGADWAVLQLRSPTAAGQAELTARGGFALVEGAASTSMQTEVRAPGFGGDYEPAGAGPRGESFAHHTLQESRGTLHGACADQRGALPGSLSYSGYFLTGASGAPIVNAAGEALGLHTHGEGLQGCGASALTPALRSAINRIRRE